MIITRPVLQRLSPTIREASPEITDGTLQVPSLFSFVGLPPEPIFRIAPGSLLLTSSFAFQQNAQVANAAQSISNMGNISAGYWRLQIQGSYRSNYVLATAQPGDMRILLADSVSNWQIVTKFAQLAGSQAIDWIAEFMCQQPLNITMILDANGAAQEHTASISVQGARLL